MSFLVIALFIAMVATFVVMVMGIISMASGGENNTRKGNKLMQYRVWFQGIALAILAILMVTKG